MADAVKAAGGGRRYRVGLVGAGAISDFHAAAVRRAPEAVLVGLYDADEERASEAARRLQTPSFPSLEALIDGGAEVIHVLTPPETHAAVAMRARELGAHVLVEKPLATDAEDCRRIAALAESRGLRVCVDHSLLYDAQVRRALAACRKGELGRIVAVDLLWSSEYPPYRGGSLPPQYRSAGYPFRDLGVHALYLMQAFLGPVADVRAAWSSLGGDPNLAFDEWRAEIRCRGGSGHAQLSWNVRPLQTRLMVRGTKGTMHVDIRSMYQSRRVVTPLPQAAERVLNAFSESLYSLYDVSQSVAGVVRKHIRQFDGVQNLVGEFYRTLRTGEPVPVSVADAEPIIVWVESVARAAERQHEARQKDRIVVTDRAPTLVTGAAGALGGAVVSRLLERGDRVRVFVRRSPEAQPDGVEVIVGDLGDPEAVDRAVRGARVVIHAGAAMKGGWPVHETSTIVGTRNVVSASLRFGVEQLVHISSMSVVDWAGARSGSPITESSPFEPKADSRGAYTRAKKEAEQIVRAAVRDRGLRAVILRPGQIFGGTLPLVNAAVARFIGGRYVVLGDGKLRLPLVYIDDVVDGIVGALDKGLVGGEVVQLVDSDLPTQNDILAQRFGKGAKVVRVPRPIVFSLGKVSEVVLGGVKRQSPLSVYRLRSALANRTYASENADRLIEWQPRVGVRKGMDASVGGAERGPAR